MRMDTGICRMCVQNAIHAGRGKKLHPPVRPSVEGGLVEVGVRGFWCPVNGLFVRDMKSLKDNCDMCLEQVMSQ